MHISLGFGCNFFFVGELDFLLEGLTTGPTLQSLDTEMQEYRFQTDADGPETTLHKTLADDILALARSTAQMFRFGLDVYDDIAGFILRFQVLLVLEPKGMVEKVL